MEFFRKTKGAISVFLIMIMLPTLTSAVLLVDGTRYHSAQTLVQEAGDLAAYSTIANYNMNLKDYYGLFAIDDANMKATFTKYFKDTLGYSATKAEEYSLKVQNLIKSSLLGSGKYSDASFFNIYNFQIGKADVTPLHPLSQPAVLQNQIVEYTKYRGIETVLERFDILNKKEQVQEETKAAQKVVEAVGELSGIEEVSVTKVSVGVGDLQDMVDAYNVKIDNLSVLKENFNKSAAEEIRAMAFNDPTLSTKKQKRADDYRALTEALDDIINSAEAISNQADFVYTDAKRAIGELEEFKSKYSDSVEACNTANEDMEILNGIISQTDSPYSVVTLKKKISKEKAEQLKKEIVGQNGTVSSAFKAIQKSYTDYQSELNSTEDTGSVRYHFYLKNGREWEGTETDYTLLGFLTGNTLKESATKAIKEYLGTADGSEYKYNFKNKYEDSAKTTGTLERELTVEEAVNIANSSKAEAQNSSADNKTISSEDASKLPSKAEKTQSEVDIPDVKADSASDTLKAANEASGSVMSSFMESTRNDILVYCYLLDNFKTRVTARGINSSTEHSGIADRNLANWRYTNPVGELDMRYRAKKNMTTFFSTHEVEYVFGGSKSEAANATVVYSWIYSTRFVNNFAAIYSAYSSGYNLRREIDILSELASAATFWRIPASVFKWIFMTAWAAAETALDMSMLTLDGYKIPLIKTKDSIFFESIFDMFLAFSFEGRLKLMRNQSGKGGLANNVNVCYEDYLIMLLAFVDRETRLLRIGDLIQMNMQKRGDSDFTMASAYTYLRADTSVSIKYMFGSLQQFKNSYIGSGLRLNNTIYQGY